MTLSNDKYVGQANERMKTIATFVSARLSMPTILMITAATDADDTTTLARHLASFYHLVGYSTAYLRIAHRGEELTNSSTTRGFTELEGKSIRVNTSSGDLEHLVSTWRHSYDVTILDAITFKDDARCARFARLADGVLVTICAGRSITREDTDTATALAAIPGVALGVVKTARRQRFPNNGGVAQGSTRESRSALTIA